MREVLISIQPKWCELIANGKKTVEVRKTRPKCEEPFKVYIYCTEKDYDKIFHVDKFMHKVFLNGRGKQKVIGEFVCDRISPICYTLDGLADVVDCNTSCLNPKDFIKYGKGKTLYGWHISDLVIYDKPKDLREFVNYNRCPYACDVNCALCHKHFCLTRAPQSWCYVELLKGGAE